MTKARDISKLSAVEADATADQTNAEVKAAVEAASDSNTFTDADHSKLNAIEASADVTDTANVTSSGALMDSELTNLAAVKAINQSLVTTADATFASLDISGNIDVDGVTNLDVVDIDGAVDMASTLAVTGVVTANAGVVVDTMTLDASTLTATGDLNFNVAGNMILDADGGNIFFNDNNTTFGKIQNSSSDFVIESSVQDKDLIFKGNDGGSVITAMTIDMSAGGNVGIGTASPSDRLVVQKDSSNIEPILVLKNDNTTDDNGVSIDFGGKDTGSNNITYGRIATKYTNHATEKSHMIFSHRNDSGAFSEWMRVTHDGNVGIGTSSATSIQGFAKVLKVEDSSNASIVVSGGVHEVENAVSSSGGWFGTATNIPQRFVTNNTERMRIDSSGRVGIGGSANANWRNDASDTVLQLGTEATFHSDANVTTELWNNAYVNNSDQYKNISTRGASRYMQYQGNHRFFTAASASAGSTINLDAERMRIHSSGVVSAPYGIELGSGLDATAANTLSDYEEGTWTPTALSGGTMNAVNSAVYIKIGNFVNAYAYISITSPNNTTDLNIGGLPFTSRNTQHYYGGGSGPSYSGNLNVTSWGSPLVLPNTTTFYWHNIAGGTSVIKNNFNSGNAMTLIFNIRYFT